MTIKNAVIATDPVCGMEVGEADNKLKTVYSGKTYYFCSEECKTTFEQRPEKYVLRANIA